MAGASVSIQLAVADLDATEAFYVGILELDVNRALTARGAPEHLELRSGDWEIIFVEEAAVVQVHPFLGERLEEYPKGVGMTIHVQVQGIEDIFDAVVEEGLDVVYPLEEKPYGVKQFWCFDPDGYLLVVEEPHRSRRINSARKNKGA
ncbi:MULTISPECIES: VOC family protein [Geobacter]|uniref:VOC family protein n=1 Tax=Geobacter TaxID=28231 RepID=UPI0025728CDB|nr:VOC family protein [Geobacter sulfurreducens]BEH10692.1 VOC family protein [Geobacter sulfurreducens subsp. ethanolicus]BET58537.1 VOC family protein [Geobacter sp. 60473]HML79551.1 VOC family protein [Geobacter sulfurreducens]